MSARDRAILHVDMDAFYASIEQRDDPSLRGKPVIVGGTGGRGVVAAASYEVRRFGVHSAMPMARALALCPHASCVPPRIGYYAVVSREIFAIFANYTPLVEGLSLDEAFLDVTASLALHGEAATIARSIKDRVRAATQLTASVGVAPNKLVAKIASDLDKPDGLTVITRADLPERLSALPVRRLPGLGRKKGEQVVAAGLATFGDLRRANDATLWPLFGRDAARMRDRASGIDDRPVIPDRDEKSISAEETFSQDIRDPKRLESELLALADRASARLRRAELVAGCVAVKIRSADFRTITRQRRLEPPTHDGRVIAREAARLLRTWLAESAPVALRLLGVSLRELAPAEQMDLFGASTATRSGTLVPHRADARSPALDATLDELRARYGSQSVRRASDLQHAPTGKRGEPDR